ncbi:MAG: molybdate ABC transporter substrate-binding protein [Pseudomonadota bacterium]
MPVVLRGFVVAALACFGLIGSPSSWGGEVRAAVASNFAAPARQIAVLFHQETGHTVELSFGSSGKFYAQIKSGAPFDVLLAADEKYAMLLEQEGLAVAGSRLTYAVGRLVLWSARRGVVDGKGEVLRSGAYRRLAIADPRLAPYGVAAQEVLEQMGLWSSVRDRLVMGENITQVYQFSATGNVELAFVALSQITRGGKMTAGSGWIVPAQMYHPIKQSAVQLTDAKDKVAAQAFLAFLKSASAVAIIRNFGYELP